MLGKAEVYASIVSWDLEVPPQLPYPTFPTVPWVPQAAIHPIPSTRYWFRKAQDLNRANQGQLDSTTSLWLTHQGSSFSHWMRTGAWADILGAEGEVMPEKGTSNEGEKLCLRHLICAFDKASPDARMGTPSHKPMHFLFLLKPVWTGFQLICHLTDIKWEKIWLINVINLSSPSPNP